MGPDFVFSHCNELECHPTLPDPMWDRLAEHQTAICVTPADELGMGHGNPMTFQAVKNGIKCGLGIVSAISLHQKLWCDWLTCVPACRIPLLSMGVTLSLKCVLLFNITEVIALCTQFASILTKIYRHDP